VANANQGQEQGKTLLFTKRSLQTKQGTIHFHEIEA
jgi:hypothetical protein